MQQQEHDLEDMERQVNSTKASCAAWQCSTAAYNGVDVSAREYCAFKPDGTTKASFPGLVFIVAGRLAWWGTSSFS